VLTGARCPAPARIGNRVALPLPMLRAFSLPITWAELVKRTARETVADNCLGLAAQLAYYFLLALVPAIVFFVSLASLFPPSVLEQMMTALARFAPGDVTTIVRDQLSSIAGGQKTGLLTFGLLMALWSSSAAIVSIVDALNSAYDIEEARPWWKVRLTAIGLTLALAVFVLVAVGLVMVGPRLAEVIASQVGLGAAFEWTWKILQWPVVFALITVAIATVNYFAPDAEQDWTWVTPGSVLATALWLIASLGFKFYLANFADYNATYGSLGGVIVLMLWFYVSGLAILVGAEMNAEIEHASPYGKDPGEKVPGQKRKLGTAAARAYEERQRSRGRDATSPVPTPQPLPAPTPSSAFAGGLVFFVTRWFRRRANE
jgi:membrane protein